MNGRKLLTLSILLGMTTVSCDKEDQGDGLSDNKQELAIVKEDLYKGFSVKGASGWFNQTTGDCNGTGAGCIEIIIIVTKPIEQVQLIKDMLVKEADHVLLLTKYKDVADKIFDPVLVNGTIDKFFKIEISFNKKTNVNYFKFIREADGVNVAVYPIAM